MTTEFKVGDRVRRTQGHYASMVAGDEGTVSEVRSDGSGIRIAEYRYGGYGFHDAKYFELVEVTPRPFQPGDRVRRTGRSFESLIQGQEYVVSRVVGPDNVYLKGHGPSYDPKYFELITNKEEIVTDLYDSDGKSITLDAYNPALLPLFTKLAAAADERGYCSEYDALAVLAGVPSRAEIKELNKPPVPTHGLEAFQALKIGDEFTVTTQAERTWGNRRFKISDTDYLVVPDTNRKGQVNPASNLESTDKIEKVTR